MFQHKSDILCMKSLTKITGGHRKNWHYQIAFLSPFIFLLARRTVKKMLLKIGVTETNCYLRMNNEISVWLITSLSFKLLVSSSQNFTQDYVIMETFSRLIDCNCVITCQLHCLKMLQIHCTHDRWWRNCFCVKKVATWFLKVDQKICHGTGWKKWKRFLLALPHCLLHYPGSGTSFPRNPC